MEITQFTYFQQMAGIECKPVSVEITYGLERICMFTQQKKNVYDLLWNDEGSKIWVKYFFKLKKNFQLIILNMQIQIILFKMFDMFELEAKALVEKKLSLPAYDQCLKASHVFNILRCKRCY